MTRTASSSAAGPHRAGPQRWPRGADGRGIQAVLFILLTWMALLCAGLGGSVGVAGRTLAGQLVPHAQHLQRQAGAPLASRSARRDGVQHIEARRIFDPWHAPVTDTGAAAPPPDDAKLRPVAQPTRLQLAALPEPPARPRPRAHPSRAPPLRA